MTGRSQVLVAMSGGVDSSTALLLLLEQGYEPLGVTLKLWDYQSVGGNLRGDSNCCSIESLNNARLLCRELGVPHYTLDDREVFRKTVVEDFVSEYLAGRTPNPCARCNTFCKWGSLLDYADFLGVPYIATGHYARIVRTNGRFHLAKGRDQHKDQSYFLWGIPPASLSRTLLPLGELTKPEVRALARQAGLLTAETPESQEICFVPDDDYRRFLNFYIPDKLRLQKTGDFIDAAGRVIKPHAGISGYTVGQRRGLGVSAPDPLYVREIDPDSGRITLVTRDRMDFGGCEVRNLNLFTNQTLTEIPNLTVRIRYNHPGVAARVVHRTPELLRLEFARPQFAVTPGQSAALYQGERLLGGGIITRGLPDA